MVVANRHFSVNTKVLETHHLDKYKGLREGHVKKIGFRLGPSKIAHLTERQIAAKK
jgi:hypothetical protein